MYILLTYFLLCIYWRHLLNEYVALACACLKSETVANAWLEDTRKTDRISYCFFASPDAWLGYVSVLISDRRTGWAYIGCHLHSVSRQWFVPLSSVRRYHAETSLTYTRTYVPASISQSKAPTVDLESDICRGFEDCANATGVSRRWSTTTSPRDPSIFLCQTTV